MLDHPKWLIFLLIVFGLIHVFSLTAATGVVREPLAPSDAPTELEVSSSLWSKITGFINDIWDWTVGLASYLKIFMTFNYSWMGGHLVYLKWFLGIIQFTFIVLILRDVAKLARGTA